MTDQPPRFATPHDALIEAIRRIGSQQKTARVCEITATSVWRWVHEQKLCPQRFVVRIARASGVMPDELRPDLHWPADAMANVPPPTVMPIPAPVDAVVISPAPAAAPRFMPTNDNCCCGCCHRLPPSAA